MKGAPQRLAGAPLRFPCKDARDLHRWLTHRGWELETTRTKHWKYRHPGTGNCTSMPGSPGDHRSVSNFKHRAIRLENTSPLGSTQ